MMARKMPRGLLQLSCAILQPEDVHIIGRRNSREDRQMHTGLVVGFRSGIEPALYLGVPIGKIETARSVVVCGGIISDQTRGGLRRIVSAHVRGKPAVVDAIFAFIEHDKNSSR